MKSCLFITGLLFCQLSFGQEKKEALVQEDTCRYAVAGLDVLPEFPGGTKELYQYIAKNYMIPIDKKLKGKIFATFVIEKDGSLTDIKVIRDIGSGTAAETIRVLKTSPKWKPGMQKGKVVRTHFALPIQLKE